MLQIISVPTGPKTNTAVNLQGLKALKAYYDRLLKAGAKPPSEFDWVLANAHAVYGGKIYLPAISNVVPQFASSIHLYEGADSTTIVSAYSIRGGSAIPTISTNNLLLNLKFQTPEAVRVRMIVDGGVKTEIFKLDEAGTVTIKLGRVVSAFGILKDLQGTGVSAKGGPYIDPYDFLDEQWSDSGYFYD